MISGLRVGLLYRSSVGVGAPGASTPSKGIIWDRSENPLRVRQLGLPCDRRSGQIKTLARGNRSVLGGS
jgi:hypothetical protein